MAFDASARPLSGVSERSGCFERRKWRSQVASVARVSRPRSALGADRGGDIRVFLAVPHVTAFRRATGWNIDRGEGHASGSGCARRGNGYAPIHRAVCAKGMWGLHALLQSHGDRRAGKTSRFLVSALPARARLPDLCRPTGRMPKLQLPLAGRCPSGPALEAEQIQICFDDVGRRNRDQMRPGLS